MAQHDEATCTINTRPLYIYNLIIIMAPRHWPLSFLIFSPGKSFSSMLNGHYVFCSLNVSRVFPVSINVDRDKLSVWWHSTLGRVWPRVFWSRSEHNWSENTKRLIAGSWELQNISARINHLQAAVSPRSRVLESGHGWWKWWSVATSSSELRRSAQMDVDIGHRHDSTKLEIKNLS